MLSEPLHYRLCKAPPPRMTAIPWITDRARLHPGSPKNYSGRIGDTLISPHNLPNDTPTDYGSAKTGESPPIVGWCIPGNCKQRRLISRPFSFPFTACSMFIDTADYQNSGAFGFSRLIAHCEGRPLRPPAIAPKGQNPDSRNPGRVGRLPGRGRGR